jgi:hypothetical protein
MMKFFKLKKDSDLSQNKHLILILRLMLLLMVVSLSGYSQNDAKSLELVAKCEKAMGGQKAYNKIANISWNFFGARTLYWNKHTGDVRIEIPKDKKILLYNTMTQKGKAMIDGVEITDQTELSKLMDQGKGAWINDSYWLVMPFKLNDPGVSKKYIGQKETQTGSIADVVELTFNEVGVTPDNKYHIYFDTDSHLVTQWDFYRNFADEKPGFSMPWQNYSAYGKVLLSGDRGERKLSEIKVFDKLPESVYNSFETVKI